VIFQQLPMSVERWSLAYLLMIPFQGEECVCVPVVVLLEGFFPVYL